MFAGPRTLGATRHGSAGPCHDEAIPLPGDGHRVGHAADERGVLADVAEGEQQPLAVRAALEGAGLPVRNLRVRDLGDVASIEVDREILDEALRLPAVADAAVAAGFPEAGLDEKGFRSGSMNELLAEPESYR